MSAVVLQIDAFPMGRGVWGWTARVGGDVRIGFLRGTTFDALTAAYRSVQERVPSNDPASNRSSVKETDQERP